MTLLNGECLITLSLCSDIVLMRQVTADAFKVRVVIAMIAVMSYKLMSVDDLQMLGVHVGRDPNQNKVVMFMTRDDCGKETKMESDAALEWIAQQCETTYPPRAKPRWM